MTTYTEFRAQFPDGEIPAHLLSAYDEARTTWALDLASAAEVTAAEADTATGPDALTRRAVANLLGEIEHLLDTLRAQPPESWENDACFSVAYGLADALGIPLVTDD